MVTKKTSKKLPDSLMNREKIGKAWRASDGSIRYYVNDWKDMIGLKVSYYNTGNVSSVVFQNYPMSNSHYNKYISGTKVWIDENDGIHVDYCRDDEIKSAIIKAVGKKLKKK